MRAKIFSEWWRPRQSFLFEMMLMIFLVVAVIIERTSATSESDSSREIISATTSDARNSKNSFMKAVRVEPIRRLPLTSSRRGRDFFGNSIGTNSLLVMISKTSWESYVKFKEETCRNEEDEYIAERILNSTENGYFSWEENLFHQELRKIILPETRTGSFNSLIGSPLLKSLDPRFFASSLESLCRTNRYDADTETLAKLEKDGFEDYLINKVLNPHLLKMGSSSSYHRPTKKNLTSTSTSTTTTTTTTRPQVADDNVTKLSTVSLTSNNALTIDSTTTTKSRKFSSPHPF